MSPACAICSPLLRSKRANGDVSTVEDFATDRSPWCSIIGTSNANAIATVDTHGELSRSFPSTILECNGARSIEALWSRWYPP
jgi:hypothetical protein